MSLIKDKKWLLDKKYKGQEAKEYFSDLERLKEGVHLDYILGESDFLHCKISLHKCPLIPRVETEYWVEKAISDIKKASKGSIKILDIFSGSGCIGVALLKHLKNSYVVFAEVREDLIETIRENIEINNLKNSSYDVVLSDIFSNINEKFDYIFANPPYIDKKRDTTLPSVVECEPHDALFAKDSGLFYIKKLIAESPNHLKTNGVLLIEFDSWQKEEIQAFIATMPKAYRKIEFLDDQYNAPRVIQLTL